MEPERPGGRDSGAGQRPDDHQQMGIVMLPDALLRDDLREGRLVPLLGDYKLPSRPMNLLYAQDRYRLPKLRSFVEFVLEKWAKP